MRKPQTIAASPLPILSLIATAIVAVVLAFHINDHKDDRALNHAAFDQANKARADVFAALHPPLPEPTATPSVLPES